MKHIAVFGCGWFGLPLAQALQQQDFQVKGSKTTEDGVAALTAAGIDGVLLNLPGAEPLPATLLAGCDGLVVNIPPGLRHGNDDLLLQKLSRLTDAVTQSALQRVIFISSTGAYSQTSGVLAEQDLTVAKEGSCAMLQQAEQLFLQLASNTLQVTVLRFAGLVGPGRHPGRFMAGRCELSGANQPVNLVHLNDCIAAVMAVLRADNPGEVYNLCAPFTMDKKTFYGLSATQLGLPLPQFQPVSRHDPSGKKIDGSLICRELGFHYQHADAYALLPACAG
ncbi:SDR family oxidoreductase [Shewanella sp. YIC-542]|uniref:SDR family oxidoreductase n=1 Tax=Shewanella mytili TaxID=3377111 RepID=UPI00398ED25E